MAENARKSPEEKLAEIEKKMEQLKARKQRMQQQISQKERKERTRRLIEIGAIFEKNFELQSKEEAEFVAHELRGQAAALLKNLRNEEDV